MSMQQRTKRHTGIALAGFVALAGCDNRPNGSGSGSSTSASATGAGGTAGATSAVSTTSAASTTAGAGGAGGASSSSTSASSTTGAGGAGGGAPAGSVLWSRVFQPTSAWQPYFPTLSANDIDALPSGGPVIVGEFNGDLDIVPTSVVSAPIVACFELSLDASGQSPAIADFGQVGVGRIEGPGTFFCRTVVTDPAGNRITLRSWIPYHLQFVTAVEKLGSPAWSKTLAPMGPGLYDALNISALSTDVAGNVLFGERNLPYMGYTEQYYTKLDPAGNQVFRLLGGYDADPPYIPDEPHGSVAHPSTGVFFLDGKVRRLLVPFPTGLWPLNLPAVAVPDASGNLLAAFPLQGTLDVGSGPITSTGPRDLALTKLDSNGAMLFKAHWGKAGVTVSRVLAKTSHTGGILVGAEVQGGTLDLGDGTPAGPTFLAAFDASGALLWHWNVNVTLDAFRFAGAPSGGAYILSQSQTLDLGEGPPLAGISPGFLVAKIAP